MLLLGKVKNGKYTESKTWHPERVEEFFLLYSMWEFLITFWCYHRGQFRPSLGQKNIFFFNLTIILSFFWELTLTLFDIPKEVGFAKVLVFSNIFGFPDVNWATKWNKTVNFGCLPVKLKFKSLKDFSNTVFVLLETTSGQNFSKIEHYLGE